MQKWFNLVPFGSDSDIPVMKSTLDTPKSLRIPYKVKITSAHRTPQSTHEYVRDAELAATLRNERQANSDQARAKDAALQKELDQ